MACTDGSFPRSPRVSVRTGGGAGLSAHVRQPALADLTVRTRHFRKAVEAVRACVPFAVESGGGS